MGMVLIWVDVLWVEGGQCQDIWMYYGNVKVLESGNGQLVFDLDYILVYYFDGVLGILLWDFIVYVNNVQIVVGSLVEGVIGCFV